MKNLTKNLIALFTVSLFIVMACKKDDPAPIPLSPEKTMSAFSFSSLNPAVTGAISGTSITATVPFGTNLNLAPTITVSAKATVSPSSGSSQDFSKSVAYTVTAEDGSKLTYNVAVSLGKSPEKDILTFAFNGITPAVACTIDATTKTISATLPAGTDATKLVPTVTLSPKASVSPASGVAQDFSKEVSYTVTAEDGGTVVYKVNVTVTVPATRTNDLVFVGGADKIFYALDTQTGVKKWEFKAGGEFTNLTPTYNAGVIYIGNQDRKMYALDAKTGAKKWEFLTNDVIKSSSPAFANGLIFFGSDDKKLYALDAETGTKKWEFITGDKVETSPTVVNGIVYFGSYDKKIYALDAVTGTKKWEYVAGGSISSSPAVVDGLLYFGSLDKSVYCLDAITGTIRWSVITEAFVFASPTVDNGIVYFSAKNVLALDAKTGNKKWEYISSAGFILTSPQVVNSIVYVGGGSNDFVALDAKTGAKKWNFSGVQYAYGSPVVANGVVFYGEFEYFFYSLDATTGTKKWNFKTAGTVYSGACVLDKNGKVYYSSDSGMVQ
jgi:eukaryotic-like serine/threonine-protein kinase